MKTVIIKHKDRIEAQEMFIKLLLSGIVTAGFYFFFDTIDENYTITVNHY